MVSAYSDKYIRLLFGLNNDRRDTHGEHPKSGEGITIMRKPSEDAVHYVVFARGGYVPFELNDLLWANKDNLDREILRVSRINVVDEDEMGNKLGYGAGIRSIGPDEGVTYVTT